MSSLGIPELLAKASRRPSKTAGSVEKFPTSIVALSTVSLTVNPIHTSSSAVTVVVEVLVLLDAVLSIAANSPVTVVVEVLKDAVLEVLVLLDAVPAMFWTKSAVTVVVEVLEDAVPSNWTNSVVVEVVVLLDAV
eukprot:CAMPEP_0178406804 /NCGR_PEP_ID=MMETSP0689_2-20121128/19099_1 /TAXON_ID=160604 /ORGANISM="Amphidinium massartii, Strain CS-259" /LENGTH=134 /DNA_ID=CAMNT_0020027853 /DNA_START=487 /DNA_END=888 /DNA_ORIENTATION=-